MKLYLISDNTETYEGMRLAGVDGMITDAAAVLMKALGGLAETGEYAVIMITEKVYSLAPERVDRFIETHTRPLVTRIPDRHGAGDRQFSLDGFFGGGIGIDL